MSPAVPSQPLAHCLEQLGPGFTPSGVIRWVREFPMGGEVLAFSAELECLEDQLVARVRESHLGPVVTDSKDIFRASWVADQGAWRFQSAALDGNLVAEQSAIATFQDYLNALAAEPSVQTETSQSRKRAAP